MKSKTTPRPQSRSVGHRNVAPSASQVESPDRVGPEQEALHFGHDPTIPLSPGMLMKLQRTIGNRATIQLLRARKAQTTRQPVQPKPAPVRPVISRSLAETIQRSIGLEIEVPVPIDQLDDDGIEYIEEKAGGPDHDASFGDKLKAKGRRDMEGRVEYGTVVENDKIRVDVDHDDRVKTPDPYEEGKGWPLPEGGLDSIIEIVTKPAANATVFNSQMDEVDSLVQDIDTNTTGLTKHWEDAYGGTNVGPLDYTSQGRAARKQPHHNFDGSIQVNLGVGLAKYGDMLEWYTESDYADPEKAKETERKPFEDAKKHIEEAVAAARDEGARLRKKYKKQITNEHNGLAGIEGWLTHVALYLIRGSAQGVGGTAKNMAPVLLKSPSSVAAEHGMTDKEREFYAGHLNNIMTGLLKRVNRNKDAKWFGKWKGRTLFPGQAEDQGGDLKIEDVSDIEGDVKDVLLTGKPIEDPGEGSDMVVEFRTLPGYHKPDAWRALGLDFLQQAEQLKKEDNEE